jgi:hypothetical protein
MSETRKKLFSEKKIKINSEKYSKEYKITFPNGDIKYIKNFSEFCRSLNIKRDKIRRNKKWKIELIK